MFYELLIQALQLIIFIVLIAVAIFSLVLIAWTRTKTRKLMLFVTALICAAAMFLIVPRFPILRFVFDLLNFLIGVISWIDVETAAFLAVAAILILSSAMVLLSKEIVRSVVYLAATFAMVASLFVLLSSEFIAIVQLLIYGGAVTVLILFAIMLTKREAGSP